MASDLEMRLAKLNAEQLADALRNHPEDYTSDARDIMRRLLESKGYSQAEITCESGAASTGDVTATSNSDTQSVTTEHLDGLRGSLLLLGAYIVWNIINTYRFIFYDWGGVNDLIGVVGLIIGAAWCVLLVLYLTRSRFLPTVMTVFLLIFSVLAIIGGIASGYLTSALFPVAGALVVITYLSQSKRVKATFIKRAKPEEEFVCPHCSTSLDLTAGEIAARKYTCPSCSKEVGI